MATKKKPRAAEGCAQASCSTFSELCSNLLNGFGGEVSEQHWLYPNIRRFKSTDWIAEIWNRPPDDAGRELLAGGQAETMEEACERCVADYHERRRIEARKEELMKEPLVREALVLFKSNTQICTSNETTPC